MQGIEKILLEIADNAKREADKIVGDAKHQAELIKADATALSKKESDEVLSNAKTQSKHIIDSANDFSHWDKSRKVLEHKRRIIDKSFDLALDKLLNLPKDDYFEFVRKCIVKYAEKGNGEVYCNSSDLKRMSTGFELTVNCALSDENSVKISTVPDDSIVGGCRILYGNIEVNLDFRTLISDLKTEITGDVAQIIFE